MIRAYVPSTLPEVRQLVRRPARCRPGTRINAVTACAAGPDTPEADDEELEFLATKAAEEMLDRRGHDLRDTGARRWPSTSTAGCRRPGCRGTSTSMTTTAGTSPVADWAALFVDDLRVVRRGGDPAPAVERGLATHAADRWKDRPMDAVTQIPADRERTEPPLRARFAAPGLAAGPAGADWAAQGPIDLPMYIDGQWTMGGGSRIKVVQPHAHKHTLGT